MTTWRVGAIVAVGWAALLGVFVVINAGYGQGAWVLVMFSSAVVLAACAGVLLFLWTRRNGQGPHHWLVPRVVTSAPLLAAAAAFVGIGIAFTWVLYVPAFWLAVLSVRRLFRERP